MNTLARATMTTAMTAAALALAGCFNVTAHIHNGASYAPYESTCAVSRSLAEAFAERPDWHGGNSGEAAMAHAYATITLPLWVVALPCESVADTITLPYDLTNGD